MGMHLKWGSPFLCRARYPSFSHGESVVTPRFLGPEFIPVAQLLHTRYIPPFPRRSHSSRQLSIGFRPATSATIYVRQAFQPAGDLRIIALPFIT